MRRPNWKEVAASAALASGAALGAAGCSGNGSPAANPYQPAPNPAVRVSDMKPGLLPPSIRGIYRSHMRSYLGVESQESGNEAVGLGIRRVGNEFTIGGFVISDEKHPDVQAYLNNLTGGYQDDTSADNGRSAPIRIKEGKFAGMWIVFYEGNNHVAAKPGDALSAVVKAANLFPLPSAQVTVTTHGLEGSGMSITS